MTSIADGLKSKGRAIVEINEKAPFLRGFGSKNVLAVSDHARFRRQLHQIVSRILKKGLGRRLLGIKLSGLYVRIIPT
ncbi:MAG: hypothetical protein IT174_00805 [Acidobacteria bacterium]|nr:hypothetical protein [Acidobacteriota bacterium]